VDSHFNPLTVKTGQNHERAYALKNFTSLNNKYKKLQLALSSLQSNKGIEKTTLLQVIEN
jgi:hypothetical protein